MIEIAGIKSRSEINGRLEEVTPVKETFNDSRVHIDKYDAIISPDAVLYERGDVLEIIKRYDAFRNAFDTADELGRTQEEAINYATHFLENKYSSYYWNGIDEFMKLELSND